MIDVNENCIGCGLCAAIDPEHFEIVDGLSHAISYKDLDTTDLECAINSCPTDAIDLID